MNHFTDEPGFKAIGSQPVWLFRALKPPGPHPFGAYFTTLDASVPNLAPRLRIPRTKLAFVFSFSERQGDLRPLRGGRGRYVFHSPHDYAVEQPRQISKGATGL